MLANSVVSTSKRVSISAKIKGFFWLGVREKCIVLLLILASVPANNERLEWEQLIPFRIHSMLPLGIIVCQETTCLLPMHEITGGELKILEYYMPNGRLLLIIHSGAFWFFCVYVYVYIFVFPT